MILLVSDGRGGRGQGKKLGDFLGSGYMVRHICWLFKGTSCFTFWFRDFLTSGGRTSGDCGLFRVLNARKGSCGFKRSEVEESFEGSK